MVVQDAQLEDALGRTVLGVAMIYDGVFDSWAILWQPVSSSMLHGCSELSRLIMHLAWLL